MSDEQTAVEQTPDEQAEVMTPAKISQTDWDEICRLRGQVQKMEVVEWEANVAHKDAKKATEVAQGSLNDYLDEVRTGQMNLYDQPEAEAVNEEWREAVIECLFTQHGLSDATVYILEQANISTIGDLSDHMKFKALIEIEGIGPANAEKIEDAMTKFWAANPQEPDEPEEDGAETEDVEAMEEVART